MYIEVENVQSSEPAMKIEIAGDRADGRGDDGLVEGGQEHAHQQAGQDREDLPVGQGDGVRVVLDLGRPRGAGG
jgi:hypothetical protein